MTGGVACNSGLRQTAQQLNLACPVFFPSPQLSTDNAVMIAAAALIRYERREFDDFTLRPKANLTLAA